MILQALNAYYDRKSNAEENPLPKEGWIRRGVDYVLVLDSNGNCLNIELAGTVEKGKIIQREMLLPAVGKQALKHTNAGDDANLLWDNAGFIFGTGTKGGKKIASFLAAIEEWLGDAQDEGISAIRRFCLKLQNQPETLAPLLEQYKVSEDFQKRDPILIFRLISDIEGIHARRSVTNAYEASLLSKASGITGTCLVSGKENIPLAANETVIKGVWGGQPAGCNIVSFNKPSFCSYGKRDSNGKNAPISLSASFRYTTALNHLLATDKQRVQVGDASTVFWAEQPHDLETLVPDLFGEPAKDEPDRGRDALRALYQSVESGRFSVGADDTRFHVLGLAPNAARISIRFWETAPARELARRLKRHFDDIAIVRADYDPEHLSLFRLLVSVAALGKADNIPPNLGGDVARAIIEDLPYPATLLNAAVQRCRAEQAKKDERTGKPVRHVSYQRAAILKAYLNQLNRFRPILEKEVTVTLDLSNTQVAYRLGRLFAVFERVQEAAAERDLNKTIRDAYFGAAMSTPRSVFPRLIRLNQHHLRDLKRSRPKSAIYFDNLLLEINSALQPESAFPSVFQLENQGIFALGYYHQRQAFFSRNEKTGVD
jgi:CRISPR-associated protein Csd1